MNGGLRSAADSADPYDQVEYPGRAFAVTHPSRIGAIGVLHGMEPVPVAGARVLELGCGDGGNLIPMAYALRDAEFIGVDIAAQPIERGRRRAAALGLRNIELRVLDLMDMVDDVGSFDFIITHGVYSWVPERVRERVLEICARHLAPQGIAFVSYLARPGNNARAVLRDMLLRHDDTSSSAAARVRRARDLMEFFSAAPEGGDAGREAVRALAIEFARLHDGVIFHDWLAPHNAALYVTEFVGQAARHGLAFVGEAEHFMTRYEHDPQLAAARAELTRLEQHDVLAKEQFLDFLRCRRFRQTLLCRADVVRSPPDAVRVRALAAASSLRAVSAPDFTTHSVAEFRMPDRTSLRVDHPIAKAALALLGESWPGAIPFSELFAAARAATGRSDAGAAADGELLSNILLACCGTGQVLLYTDPPRLATRPGERPRASAVARAEIASSRQVTTLAHGQVSIDDPLGAELLRLLDGSRDRAALIEALAQAIESGRVSGPGGPGDDVRAQLAGGLDVSLRGLARAGLLEA